MKGEGKNTTTLLSIKGFLWEDIKSIPAFQSAPASGSFPVGSTHSSAIRSATINFLCLIPGGNKGWARSPSKTLMCTQPGRGSWYWNEPLLDCAGCMLQIHTPTHMLEFFRQLCRWHYFWCQLPAHLQNFILVSLAMVCLAPFMLAVPLCTGSQVLMAITKSPIPYTHFQQRECNTLNGVYNLEQLCSC